MTAHGLSRFAFVRPPAAAAPAAAGQRQPAEPVGQWRAAAALRGKAAAVAVKRGGSRGGKGGKRGFRRY